MGIKWRGSLIALALLIKYQQRDLIYANGSTAEKGLQLWKAAFHFQGSGGGYGMNLAVEFEGILHRKAKGGYVNPRVLWHGPGEATHAERLSKSCQHSVGGCLHLSSFTAPHRTCPSLQHSQDHLVPPSSFSAKSKFCLCWLSADEIPTAFTKGGSAIPYQPHTRCRVFLNHKSTFFSAQHILPAQDAAAHWAMEVFLPKNKCETRNSCEMLGVPVQRSRWGLAWRWETSGEPWLGSWSAFIQKNINN